MLGKMFRGLSAFIAAIGALNLGVLGVKNVNLVGVLCGGVDTPISRIIHIVVGIAGICVLLGFFCPCRGSHGCCSKGHSDCDKH